MVEIIIIDNDVDEKSNTKIKIQGGPKSKPLPNDRYQIVLKSVNWIKFIRQIKVRIKHYNIIRWY